MKKVTTMLGILSLIFLGGGFAKAQSFNADENADESLRDRPVMGLILLKDFEYEDGTWEGGTIYDPKNGKTYKCRMRMETSELLYIRGYIGKAWMGLGRTTEWTRP